MTYVKVNNRKAQNNWMCHMYILNTLTDQGCKKITNQPGKYHVDDKQEFPSGCMVFKVLTNQALIDNRTTTTLHRNNLMSLDIYMVTVSSNIELFNRYVISNRQALANRGHSIDEEDMVDRLLSAYATAQDHRFNAYITSLQTDIEDGTKSVDAEALVDKAFNFYKHRKDHDLWGEQTLEQKEIVAMSAEIKSLRGGLKLTKLLQDKIKNVAANK